jgi:16S rRNA (cytidine1402-2'-O)-methyltransferase
VLVIHGKDFAEFEKEEQAKWQEMSIEEHVEYYISQGMDKKEAMKAAAADRGISKRDVYQALLEK